MTRITIKEYFATAGARLTDRDARIIGPVLAELSQAQDVDANAVVEAARSANCPLHSYFEWDDKVAADKYRVGQAEEMINAVRVRFVSEDGGHERTTRAYRIASVKADAPARHSAHLPLVQEWAAAVSGDELMGDALRELQQWRIKYRPYAEMLGEYKDVAIVILNQIAEFLDEFKDAQLCGKQPLEAIADLRLWTQRHGAMAGPAGEFAEQFKYMMEAIEEAERAFDPDAQLESALARENRMLRQRIAELEGDTPMLAAKIQKRLGLTKTQAKLMAALLENEHVEKKGAMRLLYPWRSEEEMPEDTIIDVFICKIRDVVAERGLKIETIWGTGYCLSAASKARLRSIIEHQEAEAA